MLRTRLQDGGLLLLVLPIDDWRVERDFTGCDNNHHLHTWTPRLIANTLSEAGLVCTKAEVLTHAWPYKWETLYRVLPRWAFELSCRFFGWAIKRRQLFVIAEKKPSQEVDHNTDGFTVRLK